MGKKNAKLFTVVAVKWFDKINGNTYHSCYCVRHSDGAELRAPYQYGYGDQYRETALALMQDNGWISGGQDLWLYERENGYPVIWVEYKSTKKACKTNGGERR